MHPINLTFIFFLVCDLALLIYKVKQLFRGLQMLSDSDSRFEEAMAMVHAQNKMKKAGMPERVCIA